MATKKSRVPKKRQRAPVKDLTAKRNPQGKGGTAGFTVKGTTGTFGSIEVN